MSAWVSPIDFNPFWRLGEAESPLPDQVTFYPRSVEKASDPIGAGLCFKRFGTDEYMLKVQAMKFSDSGIRVQRKHTILPIFIELPYSQNNTGTGMMYLVQ